MRTIKEYAMVPTGPTKMIDFQRAEAGVEKYLEDFSRGILISGYWNGTGLEGYVKSQSEQIYGRIIELSVPKDSIKFEDKSKNTLENVFYGCNFLVDKRAESVIIVTDQEHAKRFELLFGVAKDDRILPKSFNVETFSEGIDLAYPVWKSKLAYMKDYFKTFNGIKVD